MIRVTISNEGKPQFYEEFQHECLADEYAAMWRDIAVKSGVMIQINREKIHASD